MEARGGWRYGEPQRPLPQGVVDLPEPLERAKAAADGLTVKAAPPAGGTRAAGLSLVNPHCIRPRPIPANTRVFMCMIVYKELKNTTSREAVELAVYKLPTSCLLQLYATLHLPGPCSAKLKDEQGPAFHQSVVNTETIYTVADDFALYLPYFSVWCLDTYLRNRCASHDTVPKLYQKGLRGTVSEFTIFCIEII
ncbi:hypothetical protein P7K49_006932 [Saguinus oedipus]|uniref:Uncharacterized protein n=1 Tax=Saguinus oedipus TaxID=9490 RepID=A0ABQ9W3W0_SAGOE|nr:hypothetical protein P7K49_006932 [Saguinus oedipus]